LNPLKLFEKETFLATATGKVAGHEEAGSAF